MFWRKFPLRHVVFEENANLVPVVLGDSGSFGVYSHQVSKTPGLRRYRVAEAHCEQNDEHKIFDVGESDFCVDPAGALTKRE